jgi:hypothetical protein
MCDCGCNTCDNTKISLNESLVPKQLAPQILSEGLNYHLENNIPLYENIYQYGSEKYFTLLNEARKLYTRGMLDLNEDDEDLIRTNIGAFGMCEGKRVPLDFPMLNEDLDEQKEYTKGDFEQMASREFKPGEATNSDIVALARKAFLDYKFGRGFKQYFPKTFLEEAKKKKKNTKPIGKPMRSSSGGKAYKVYVKDPKTGNIKTVRFGSGGLKAKINNSKARAAFSKRHNCPQKKDRTKASYWSCRLPRYAKLLGLKSSFSGFW